MRAFEIGVVLSSRQSTTDGSSVPWTEIHDLALRAEVIGFDTLWSPDELIGRLVKGGPRYGFWDGVAIPAALASATSRIKIGTWVLSSLHRNPGIRLNAMSASPHVPVPIRTRGPAPRRGSGTRPELTVLMPIIWVPTRRPACNTRADVALRSDR